MLKTSMVAQCDRNAVMFVMKKASFAMKYSAMSPDVFEKFITKVCSRCVCHRAETLANRWQLINLDFEYVSMVQVCLFLSAKRLSLN